MSGGIWKNGKFWLGLIISGAFLYVAFRGIDFGRLAEVISKVNLFWIAIGVSLYLVHLSVRACRWRYIFRHVKKVSFGGMYQATLVGYFANNVLPMRLGEVGRAIYVGEKEGVDKSSALGTIAVERLFDGLSAVGLLGITFWLFEFPPELVGTWSGYFRQAGMALGGIGAGGLVIMFIMVRRREWSLRILDKILARFPRKIGATMGGLAHSFIDGLAILSSPFEILVLLALSALVWLTNLWPVWASGMAFGAEGMKFAFSDQLLLMSAGAVAASIPASPGFVGTFHYATKKAVEIILTVKFAGGGISATGIKPDAFGEWGLSYAILMHALYIITTTSLGAVTLALSGVKLGQLRKEASGAETEETG